MLKGIDPVLSPELLFHLARLGHNEWVAVVDANFTAHKLAHGKPVIHLPGLDLARVCKAVLSVFPVCADVPFPAGYMHHSGQPQGFQTGAQAAVSTLILAERTELAGRIEAIERFAFYERFDNVSLIVQTGELTPYANFLFCKDVVLPEA